MGWAPIDNPVLRPRGFVEANGGELRLQADSADGTAFAVSFPLVEQPALVG